MMKMDGNTVLIDFNKAMEKNDEMVIQQMRKLISSHIVKNAETLDDLSSPFNGDVELENVPKPIKINDAPETMTVKELKENNALTEQAENYISTLKRHVKVQVNDDESIHETVKKEYPQITDEEFQLIMSYARDIWRFDNCWVQNVADLVRLTVALKRL